MNVCTLISHKYFDQAYMKMFELLNCIFDMCKSEAVFGVNWGVIAFLTIVSFLLIKGVASDKSFKYDSSSIRK